MCPHPTSWRSISILSSHRCLHLQIGLLPLGFPTKTLYTPLLSQLRALLLLLLLLLLIFWSKPFIHNFQKQQCIIYSHSEYKFQNAIHSNVIHYVYSVLKVVFELKIITDADEQIQQDDDTKIWNTCCCYHSAVCNILPGVTLCGVMAKTTDRTRERRRRRRRRQSYFLKKDSIPVRPSRILKTHKYISLVGEKLIHALQSPVEMGKIRKMEKRQNQARKRTCKVASSCNGKWLCH